MSYLLHVFSYTEGASQLIMRHPDENLECTNPAIHRIKVWPELAPQSLEPTQACTSKTHRFSQKP